MTEHVAARELSPGERDLLERLLRGAIFPGARELADQIGEARVTGGIPTLLDLDVSNTAQRSTHKDGPIPIRAFVERTPGEVSGEVLLWVKDGCLAGLEFAWYSDEKPTSMPDPDRLRIE